MNLTRRLNNIMKTPTYIRVTNQEESIRHLSIEDRWHIVEKLIEHNNLRIIQEYRDGMKHGQPNLQYVIRRRTS